ncbi:NADH:ubiquinone reductase (Na(+)-transporting) subunit D [Membranicola marinus]|uniref:Na(+)-translocating NADH-quinone reductase subunit D n=1 Tax=Membranihabitans marinus TaxID=1227546 RepID=A0A953HJY0_9BACT|nr:NADH:ubiquinone reductase (Na(+)-transporting) subunit D [Membranihabitans marinus]MBY5957249.1 NADH:ubiquinone reductase (Na(+)-transporting) subunit D [Membranihabitans marinus]
MAETINKEKAPLKEKKPLFEFGKKERKLITDPLNDDNPITVQVLGICSALAVTTLVYPSFVMTIAVIFVCAFSNLFTSLLRSYIPKAVRMIVQLVIIATLVTIVELTLKAVNYTVYKQLSVFIGLIITNCIVMGRLEAFAMANKPWRSFLDGIGNGLGYGAILLLVGIVREIFGKGTLFAGSPFGTLKFIGASPDYLINTAATSGFDSWFGWYQNNGLMVISASAMFIIAVLIWAQRAWNTKLIDVS